MTRFFALNFHDFSNGQEIDEDTVNDWINEVLDMIKKQIEEGMESPFAAKSSGNTMVFAWISDDFVQLHVSNKYKNAHINVKDLGIGGVV